MEKPQPARQRAGSSQVWKFSGITATPNSFAAAEDFPHGAHGEQRRREPQAHAQAIEKGAQRRVPRGEGLGAGQYQAVHHDQGDERAEIAMNFQAERLDRVVDDRDEGRR
ncbi:MAG: hypothetical protein U5K56_13390 [Halioglobus sp.]|nr:hypothetical protein [Halioglobus sp.]